MTIEEKVAILNSSSLFENIPDPQLQQLAGLTEEESFAEDEIMIAQDESSDKAYFLVGGVVKVYRVNEEGVEINLATKGPGNILGEMALLDGNPRSAYVQAISPIKTFSLKRVTFTKFVFENPQFAINLLKSLVIRFREINQRYEDIISKNLEDRTLTTLQTLAGYFPNQDILLSQEELASIIGATRSRVTEALNKLEHEHKITISHRKIHLN